MVAPVAVGDDPDLEERRLALLDPRLPVAVKVRIPGPDQTSEKPCASSTLFSNPVPWSCTHPFQSAPTSLSRMPGRISPWTCSIAPAAISFASLIRSSSCSVLIARAAASSGVASAASGNASNQALGNVVGSPTIRSAACVPRLSSIPTRS